MGSLGEGFVSKWRWSVAVNYFEATVTGGAISGQRGLSLGMKEKVR